MKRSMSHAMRQFISTAGGAALIAIATLSPGRAQTAVRVGKAVPEAFSFVPLDVGVREGFFKKRGLDIESIAFSGDAKMQQAAAAGGVDFLLGSGPALGFIAKGSPIKGVAAMAGAPLLLAIVVRPDGPKTAADLKGKKISVSTAGSLTYFLVSEESRRQGWGPKGIDIKPMGDMGGQIAAMKRGDTDGIITDIGNALNLQKLGEGRILVRFTDMKDFHIHVIFATDKVVAERPAVVKSFLEGWFESIRFMRANKEATVKIAAEVTDKSLEITAQVYDELMPMFSDDGKFDPKALALISRSLVELDILKTETDMSKLVNEAFLPK